MLADLIRRQPGDRLESEPELARKYFVSRTTLREVLRSLEAEGHVRRVHGVGTFVGSKPPVVPFALDLDIGITRAVEAANLPLEIVVLSSSEQPAAEWLRDRLSLEAGQSVLGIDRIIKARGVAVVRSFDAIPWHILEQAGEPAYKGGSVLRFLEEDCGQRILGGFLSVTAVNAPAPVARELGVPRSSAVLRLDDVQRSVDSVPVLFSREYHVPPMSSVTVSRIRARLAEERPSASLAPDLAAAGH